MGNKNFLFKITQVLFACSVLVILFWHIDINKIQVLLGHACLYYLGFSFLVLICQIILITCRWLILLRTTGFLLPFWHSVGYCSMSNIFNLVVPGGIGGDIFRIWISIRSGIPSKVSTFSIIADRIFGIVGYTALVFAIILFDFLWAGEKLNGINKITLIFGGVLIGGFFICILISSIVKNYITATPRLLKPFVDLSQIIFLLFKHPLHLFSWMGVNLLVHISQIIAVILLVFCLQVPLSFQDAFLGISIVLLLSTVPIVPGGWGVRESMMILVLHQFNVATESALSISILFGLGSAFSGLPIAAWWALNRLWKKSNIITLTEI